MAMRDKIEHAIQNQPCTVKDLKNKFGGDRGADRKVMEAVDQLVHEAVICQRQGVFFTVRSGRADKARPVRSRGCNAFSACQTACKQAGQNSNHKEHHACNAGDLSQHLICRGQTCIVGTAHTAVDGTGQALTVGVLHEGEENDDQRSHQQNGTANNFDNRHES